tara:strand:- start:112 stop:714 length:603 start_codon:yes stop_codon:yes gene_type:complete
MFGFGKKKVSACKYGINTVGLSISMATTFVDAWNSKRHKYEIEPLDRNNDKLFKFFAHYNLMMNSSKTISKLENPQDQELFRGLTLLMYLNFSKDEGVIPSNLMDLNFNQLKDEASKIMAGYLVYIQEEKNKREHAMGEMISYFVNEMLITNPSAKLSEFVNELISIIAPIHDESWAAVKNIKEIPVMDEEAIDYWMRSK